MSEITPGQVDGFIPQVKVCGLTSVDEALACAKAGVDAIGLVFYPPSPRFVSDSLAREIVASLPESVWPVGVFVNEPYSAIMKKVESCHLRAVQLHGSEPPFLIYELLGSGVTVIKSFFINRRPGFSDLSFYPDSACLVESGGGPMPGGNALAWKWSAVKDSFCARRCILAGGLDPDNVTRAIVDASPDAVDVSSGVESKPGRKDIGKVRAFLDAVRHSRLERMPRRIFQ